MTKLCAKLRPGWMLAIFAAWIVLLLPEPALADKRANPGSYDTNVRYLYVQPGQTLNNIVRRLYPQRKKDWPKLRKEIVRNNPHAFVNGKESSMKAGVKLTLPVRQVVKPTPAWPRGKKQVGEIVDARGRAYAIGRDRVKRDLAAGKPVYLGDKMITGEDGFLRMRMIDDALLDLRCFSSMVIEQYEFKQSRRASVLNLLKGSVRKVTGEIGRSSKDVYQLKTAMASIGVRGTEYALRVYQSKGCDGSIDTGDDALFLEVLDGEVDVSNKAAKTAVAKGDAVYVPRANSKPVERDIDDGVIVLEDDAKETSFWWYILGGLALIALL